jgi:hypothetical protein
MPYDQPNLPVVADSSHVEGHRETEPTGPVDESDDPHPDVEELPPPAEPPKRKGARKSEDDSAAASTAADRAPES